MEYVMEAGQPGSAALSRIFSEGEKDPEWTDNNRIISLKFKDKRTTPLQASDILAYELYKQGLRLFGRETRNVRYPLRQIARSLNEWHYVDDEELRRVNDWLSSYPLDGSQS